jgi:hypothetical protein
MTRVARAKDEPGRISVPSGYRQADCVDLDTALAHSYSGSLTRRLLRH